MHKILILCHGNICRSVAGEYILKNMVNKLGLSDDFEIKSKALSSEEIGNDIYPPMKECLKRNGVPFDRHYASRFELKDYNYYDRIYIMDESNLRLINRVVEDVDDKIKFLNGYIEDPWYTGNYDKVFRQIEEGCLNILKELGKC